MTALGGTPAVFTAAQEAYQRQTPPALARTDDPDQARATAADFEAFFLSQMVSHMFAGIETDPLFGGGPGENVYRSMLYQEFGNELAQNGGIGIADSLMREILNVQEVD